MNEYEQIIGIIGLSMGLGWASGVNLYAAILTLGVLSITGSMELSPGLETLNNPLVIGAAGLMFVVEFFADKIPGLDSTWDAIHTFIRIPAGAVLAASALGDVSGELTVAAGILGGTLAATSHVVKAGSRVLINASPEPFSNWTASVTEDVAVVGGVWLALYHPLVMILLIVVFVLLAIWLMPKLWRGIRKLFGSIARLFGDNPPDGGDRQVGA
ncbi:MAG: DUF4126 domain-containing protein [Desulfobulbaceae bacterium]|jgi:hypothetical protein|nr:DUF4126 domain-containing protein [Desulfobulbaceae bacterium]